LTTKEISIFVNSSHFEWRAALSDTILKRDHQTTIPAKFVLIWFSGFRGEDLICEIFSANLFRLGILWDTCKNHIKIFCLEIWVKMIFGWPTFKIMCNIPIFYQLSMSNWKQVSNYRLLGASSNILAMSAVSGIYIISTWARFSFNVWPCIILYEKHLQNSKTFI
jgi:hypothetical protein